MRADDLTDGLPDLVSVRAIVEQQLAPLGNRLIHSRAVGARAAELVDAVPPADRHLLIVAAWLHDIGYAPAARSTGLHALDGALWLAGQGFPRRLCALVAHHSAAAYEAAERGLSLAEWDDERSPVTDALWVADMTTGPAGEPMSYEDRLGEITDRYDEDSPAYRAMINARPVILESFSRTESRLRRSPGAAAQSRRGHDQSGAASTDGSSAPRLDRG